MMRRTHRLVIAGTFASIALTVLPLGSTRADESSISKPSSSGDPAEPKPGAYDRLLRELEAERQHMREVERRHEEEEAAERKRIEALEKEVSAINSANLQLQQTQTTLQTTNAQTEKQVSQIQKTVSSELGPFNFGDRINSFLGQHTFTMVGDTSVGYYYDRKGGDERPGAGIRNQPDDSAYRLDPVLWCYRRGSRPWRNFHYWSDPCQPADLSAWTGSSAGAGRRAIRHALRRLFREPGPDLG